MHAKGKIHSTKAQIDSDQDNFGLSTANHRITSMAAFVLSNPAGIIIIAKYKYFCVNIIII